MAEYLNIQTQTREDMRLGQSGLTTLPDAKIRAVVFGSRMRMITAENLCKHRDMALSLRGRRPGEGKDTGLAYRLPLRCIEK